MNFPALFASDYLKEHLILETTVHIKTYPCKRMAASSIVYDYLGNNGYMDLVKKYDLVPFEVNVQAAERTLIDKLYALGDYYLSGAVREHSRHIYDIFKLSEIVFFNEELKELIKAVYEDRKPHKQYRSAKEGVDMNRLLQEIIDKEVYKKDYQDITEKMLFEEVPYDTVIKNLQKIVNERLF